MTSPSPKGLDMRGMGLTHWMLTGPMRKRVVERIKKPLMKAITILASRYPPPLREWVLHPNTFILLDIRDKFFEHEDNPERDALFQALFKMFIVEYEHDPYYRWRIDWILDEIKKSDWLPKPPLPWDDKRKKPRWKP